MHMYVHNVFIFYITHLYMLPLYVYVYICLCLGVKEYNQPQNNTHL